MTPPEQSLVWDRNKTQFVHSKAVLRPKASELCHGNRNTEVKNY